MTSCELNDLQFKSPFTVTINKDSLCSVSFDVPGLQVQSNYLEQPPVNT